MFRYLEYLRKKPESYKKTFAIMFSFFVVAVIFVVWFSIIYPEIKSSGQKRSQIQKNEPGAFSAFGANIFQGFNSISESLGELRNSVDGLNNMIKGEYYQSDLIQSNLEQYQLIENTETASSTTENENQSDLQIDSDSNL